MNPLPVLHHGGRWLAYSGRQRRSLDAAPELERPARVLAELPGAISAVTTIKGARAHVAAQIEKRLREDGLTDGESQVIVHHVERLGGACRVFYTACPAEAWQDLLAWAQAQSDHCLVFLPEALLWHCLAPGQGVVARLGRHLYFIGRHGRQPLYARATALSDGNDELLAAASLLGRRVAGQLAGLGSRLALHWQVIDDPASSGDGAAIEAGLLDAFAGACGERVERGPHEAFVDGGRRLESALPRLLAQAPVRIALNPLPARAAAAAERGLPWLAAAALVGAVLLAGLAAWQGQGQRSQAAELARLAEENAGLRRQLADLAGSRQLPADLAPTLEFLQRVGEVDSRLAPVPLLAAIAQASDDALAILRVRSDAGSEGNGTAIVVEGRLRERDGDRHLARFVQQLRLAGYQPAPMETAGTAGGQQPAGFFAYRLQPAAGAGIGGTP